MIFYAFLPRPASTPVHTDRVRKRKHNEEEEKELSSLARHINKSEEIYFSLPTQLMFICFSLSFIESSREKFGGNKLVKNICVRVCGWILVAIDFFPFIFIIIRLLQKKKIITIPSCKIGNCLSQFLKVPLMPNAILFQKH